MPPALSPEAVQLVLPAVQRILSKMGPKSEQSGAIMDQMLALTRGSLDPREAYALWEREGRPVRERYGITVSGDREWAWLDEPTGPYAWPLPTT